VIYQITKWKIGSKENNIMDWHF